ncbi:MAG TPA: hypothetical protein VLD19_05380 [Chitinophagaceae bacterium]|nr:hypothetical protein [Chitinophagaceae bacterium]
MIMSAPPSGILPLPSYSLTEQFEKQARARLQEQGTQDDKLSFANAQLAVARSYGFDSWAKLAEFTVRINRQHSEVMQFESAANAVVTGDIATLGALLRGNPELVHLRSMRVHHATLLHYVSANGVESYRRQSPANAVAVATLLLDAGAEVNAPYPGPDGDNTTLDLVATSMAAQRAGVQLALMETLLHAGARRNTSI